MGHGILLLGSGGRLGAALQRAWLAAGENVRGLRHAELDLADLTAVRAAITAAPETVVVNCAALTNVDYCETHPAEAFRINAEAVGVLAQACTAGGKRCLHISTDYVFDGAATEPYREEDAARPISHYGASKLAGEEALLAAGGEHLAVRVSWVFGPDRPSFVDGILNRALQEEQVEAIADKWANPTSTLESASLLQPLLTRIRATGLLHLCNGGGCTWQEYGAWALQCAQEAGAPVRTTEVGALRMADLRAFIARRPPYTVMSTARLTALTGATPRPWREAVRSYVREHWLATVRS